MSVYALCVRGQVKMSIISLYIVQQLRGYGGELLNIFWVMSDSVKDVLFCWIVGRRRGHKAWNVTLLAPMWHRTKFCAIKQQSFVLYFLLVHHDIPFCIEDRVLFVETILRELFLEDYYFPYLCGTFSFFCLRKKNHLFQFL